MELTRGEPQSAADYDDRTTAAVKSVLIEIGQILGSFLGKIRHYRRSRALAASPTRKICRTSRRSMSTLGLMQRRSGMVNTPH